MTKRIIHACCVALAMVVVAGCQGRLHLLVYNDSGSDAVLSSDGKDHPIAIMATVRLPSPIDKTLTVSWASEKTTYSIPFGPRPYTLNEYMNGGKLVLHVQIMPDRSLAILPDNVPFQTGATNLPARVIRITGKTK